MPVTHTVCTSPRPRLRLPHLPALCPPCTERAAWRRTAHRVVTSNLIFEYILADAAVIRGFAPYFASEFSALSTAAWARAN